MPVDAAARRKKRDRLPVPVRRPGTGLLRLIAVYCGLLRYIAAYCLFRPVPPAAQAG